MAGRAIGQDLLIRSDEKGVQVTCRRDDHAIRWIAMKIGGEIIASDSNGNRKRMDGKSWSGKMKLKPFAGIA